MDGQQRDKMASKARNNANERPPVEHDRSSDNVSSTFDSNCSAQATQAYMYFHDKILKDQMMRNTIPSRLKLINQVKVELLEEFDNVQAMQEKVRGLMDRYEQYKKA